MTINLLEKIINASDLIISRSGYTTIMDLAKLNKKFLILKPILKNYFAFSRVNENSLPTPNSLST